MLEEKSLVKINLKNMKKKTKHFYFEKLMHIIRSIVIV